MKREDSTEGRTGVCRSANHLLLFAAQLHPTGASKAQSKAAGKLEERSEGEGPHQLSQQRKDRLCSSLGQLVSVCRRKGGFWGAETHQSQVLVGPWRDSRFTPLPWGCCHAWLTRVPTLAPSWCVRAAGRGDRAPLSSGALGADGSPLPDSGSGAAFGELLRPRRGEGCTLCAREPFYAGNLLFPE